jgi:hypothetical protein
MKKTWLMTIALLSIALPIGATETRCGWLINPTPANFYLEDRDGNWVISSQGGYQAQGLENLPPLDEQEHIKTNGNYGYRCACLEVVTDTDSERIKILAVQSGEQLPLNICRTDPDLRQFSN